MQFVSLEFLLFVAASLCAFHVAGTLHLKRLVLLVSNVAFAAFLVSTPRAMAPMALFLAGSFGLVRIVHARRARGVLVAALVATIGTFVVLKQYIPAATLFPTLQQPYSVIGLSYVLFRVLHLQIDSHEGAIEEPISARAFVNYCCFFPAWLSGPIQRYEDHAAQDRQMECVILDAAGVRAALSRIVTGVFKIGVVSAVLFDLQAPLAGLRLDASYPVHFAATLATAAALYTLYMYYNFAGYMDVAIGVACLYGLRLPENFDHPFRSESMLEFWSRWHITLSDWFHTYLFNPLLRGLAMRFGTRRTGPYLGVVAYLATFTVMGTWHGATPVFIVYGLILGLTGAGNKLYEIEARRLLGKTGFRRLRENRVYAALCRGAVFATFSGALICFWAPTHLLRAIVAHPGVVALGLLGLVVLAAASLSAGSALRLGWDGVAARLPRPHGPLWAHLSLGTRAYVVVLLVAVQRTSVPTFVYVPF